MYNFHVDNDKYDCTYISNRFVQETSLLALGLVWCLERLKLRPRTLPFAEGLGNFVTGQLVPLKLSGCSVLTCQPISLFFRTKRVPEISLVLFLSFGLSTTSRAPCHKTNDLWKKPTDKVLFIWCR